MSEGGHYLLIQTLSKARPRDCSKNCTRLPKKHLHKIQQRWKLKARDNLVDLKSGRKLSKTQARAGTGFSSLYISNHQGCSPAESQNHKARAPSRFEKQILAKDFSQDVCQASKNHTPQQLQSHKSRQAGFPLGCLLTQVLHREAQGSRPKPALYSVTSDLPLFAFRAGNSEIPSPVGLDELTWPPQVSRAPRHMLVSLEGEKRARLINDHQTYHKQAEDAPRTVLTDGQLRHRQPGPKVIVDRSLAGTESSSPKGPTSQSHGPFLLLGRAEHGGGSRP